MPSKYTKELLTEVANRSENIGQVLTNLGLYRSGGNHCHISSLLKKFEVDISHFNYNVRYGVALDKKPWQEHLVKTDNTRRKDAKILRRCLIESGREYKCEKCNNKGQWKRKKLTLQVDHINRDKSDNRPDNLRFLCPNCHTQTDGYAGQKIKTNL